MRHNVMTHEQPPAPTHAAEVAREYVPDGEGQIHGVTFDGKSVWFARDDEVVAFDPLSGDIVRRIAVPGADAGTAWDGEHLYQLAKGEILVIDPSDGQIVRRLPAPGKGEDSGMAWADGYLWVGQCYGARIHKVDAATGEVVKTLTSDRFVTGVTCIDGQLWHGAAGDDRPAELRRLAADGTPEEVLSVPVAMIAGVEAAGDGSFWCAGERGKLRLVRRTSEG
ncbi:glutamine cyclotransferase [Nannocystis pusilla]|uniref:glutamine cyclotransferase n=1 Tax=Nannocystis pusilla TaxID=889268 RepID=UPI003BF07A0A